MTARAMVLEAVGPLRLWCCRNCFRHRLEARYGGRHGPRARASLSRVRWAGFKSAERSSGRVTAAALRLPRCGWRRIPGASAADSRQDRHDNMRWCRLGPSGSKTRTFMPGHAGEAEKCDAGAPLLARAGLWHRTERPGLTRQRLYYLLPTLNQTRRSLPAYAVREAVVLYVPVPQVASVSCIAASAWAGPAWP